MNRLALPWIAALTLVLAACGQVVQIGSQISETPPSPGDPCVKLACGDSCPLTFCTGLECPPSVGGFCTLDGVCTPDPPVCAGPASPCLGLTCGTPCDTCDPASPNCSTSADAGPANLSMVCDAFQQCVPGPVGCP